MLEEIFSTCCILNPNLLASKAAFANDFPWASIDKAILVLMEATSSNIFLCERDIPNLLFSKATVPEIISAWSLILLPIDLKNSSKFDADCADTPIFLDKIENAETESFE